MLFRGPHESNDVGTIGSRTGSERSGDDDETRSIGDRSYTSAESATAQSFEMRMAQLNGNGPVGSGSFPEEGTNGGKLLAPSYQLFPTAGKSYGSLNGEGELHDGSQGLTLVNGIGDDEHGGVGGALLAVTAVNGYPDDDERDDDYLAALLSDIERHAARLDTQFFRYPSAESLKQHMATHAATQEGHSKSSQDGGTTEAGGAVTAGEGAIKTEAAVNGGTLSTNTEATPTANATATTNPNHSIGTSGSPHSTGTKLFLGGLRYEVIQSGRQTVSWIFQVACGVHINPASILIHRKTKNGRSNVAPTGCASVFVVDDNDVATLLEMNQRIYCAEEGVYVSPSPDVMKELIVSKDIVDVTGGRVRGPTHPVVIERAYSVSHHHGHHHHHHSNGVCGNSAAGGAAGGAGATSAREHGGGAAATAGNAGGANGGAGKAGNRKHSAASGSGSGSHRNARTPSVASVEGNLSNKLVGGGMPPPYGGAMPPQYTMPNPSSAVSPYQLPSYAPSSVSSSSLSVPAVGMPIMGSSPRGFPPNTMMMSGQSTPPVPQIFDDGRNSNAMGPLRLDTQRVTFHAYVRGSKTGETGPKKEGDCGRVAAQGAATTTAHTVLFLAALPSDATEDYVSWLFSLMPISLPTTRIHIIGGSSAPPTRSGATTTVAAAPTADCCATVSVSEGDVSIALNYHHRVLCTPQGAWIGHSAQDIAALRASDPVLRDVATLHVDRRMRSKPVTGAGGNTVPTGPTSGSCGGAGGLPAAYPHALGVGGGGVGDRGGPNGSAGPSMPPPPSTYPQMFGAMPLPGGRAGSPGGVLPMAAAPWSFVAPQPSVPPPPSGALGGGTSGGMPPGALQLSSVVPSGRSGYPMPPPPPPFSFTQSVTIGDRTYQLPPGATVQYVPVITSTQGMPSTAGGGEDGGHMNVPSATTDRTKGTSTRASMTAGKKDMEGGIAGSLHTSLPPHSGGQHDGVSAA